MRREFRLTAPADELDPVSRTDGKRLSSGPAGPSNGRRGRAEPKSVGASRVARGEGQRDVGYTIDVLHPLATRLPGPHHRD